MEGKVRNIALWVILNVLWPISSKITKHCTPLWKKYINKNRFILVKPDGAMQITESSPKDEGSLRVVCMSDTHGRHASAFVPQGDLLILCGDITDIGSGVPVELQIKHLDSWIGQLGFKYAVVIAGNHDGTIQQLGYEKAKSLFKNANYLQHDYVEIEGLRIWGSPSSCLTKSPNKAFQLPRKSVEMRQHWDQIPDNLDILVTHSPPKGYLDHHGGCEMLAEAVMTKQPRYHVFGHIHKGHGVTTHTHKMKRTIFINAATSSGFYLPWQRPSNSK